jgi:diguanylate cyclase (GGDEF)-like protein/PAS domain S-box-containing protein
VVVIDLAFCLIWGNEAAEERFGWKVADMEGDSAVELLHPDDAAFAAVSLASVQERAVGSPIEVRVRDASGLYSSFEVRGRVAGDVVVLVLRDLTERRRWDVAGGDATLLQAIIDSAAAITLLLDPDGSVRGASRAIASLLGHDVELVQGLSFASLAVEEDVPAVSAELALAAGSPGSRSFEARFRRADGGPPVPMNVTVANLGDDRAIEGLVVTAVGIGALFEARAELEHLAAHDDLTGLHGRAAFRDLLDDALTSDTEVAVLYCDVDRFKVINDTRGHAVGDLVLREIGRRLTGVVRADDVVARFGGDEFVVLVRGSSAEELGSELIRRVHEAMAAPVYLPDGATLDVALSVGHATSSLASDAEELLVIADAAMYRAKQLSRRSISPIGATAPDAEDLVESLMVRHAHQVLNRATSALGVLETLLVDGEELDPARSRAVLGAGVHAAETIRDDLRSMTAGIVSEVLGGVDVEGPALHRRFHAEDASSHPWRDRREPIEQVLRSGRALRIAYQPIVDLDTRETVGHEAFARFAGGRRPELWFAEAHEVGLGVELEMAAISAAMRGDPGPGVLSLNLSAATLTSDALRDLLTACPEPSRLVLELHAREAGSDLRAQQDAIGEFRSAGIRIAFGGIGTRPPSMRELDVLAPEIFKIDRSLVAFIDSDASRRSVVRSLVGLARSVAATVIAVGIEREPERAMCIDLGIGLGQGYLFGRSIRQP